LKTAVVPPRPALPAPSLPSQVRFRENFVADVMTSMVVILRDMATMVFFYMDGGATGMPSGEATQPTFGTPYYFILY
jgi:hypothetical protein